MQRQKNRQEKDRGTEKLVDSFVARGQKTKYIVQSRSSTVFKHFQGLVKFESGTFSVVNELYKLNQLIKVSNKTKFVFFKQIILTFNCKDISSNQRLQLGYTALGLCYRTLIQLTVLYLIHMSL